MPTTTNYGWTTPADTDLVKDGAAAIRTLGNSVDTTTKNLNPETTLGDISYRSSTANTNTRLPIGTTGQVLTVASGVPSWAAPAGGGKVLQVVSATTTTDTTIASATLTDTTITGTITPTLSTSKVLVLITAQFKQFRNSAGFTFIAAELLRGATTIADWNKTDADEFDGFQISPSSANAYRSGISSLIYLDSPATTSATTYKLQARGYDGSVSVDFQQNGAVSTITLLEVGA